MLNSKTLKKLKHYTGKAIADFKMIEIVIDNTYGSRNGYTQLQDDSDDRQLTPKPF